MATCFHRRRHGWRGRDCASAGRRTRWYERGGDEVIDGRTLMELLADDYGWRKLIERLHDDAGLDAYDYTLIVEAAEELAWALGEEIFDLTRNDTRRYILIQEWLKKNASATTEA